MAHRTIDFRKPPTLSFFPQSDEDEIVQSIYCILFTQKGTVPFYRDYGLAPDWLHRPINAAQTAYAVALVQALRYYEPRVKVDQVRFDADVLHPDRLYPILEVTIRE